ncbi:Crp/Fnr family transcriptional regulator [Chryseobacterium terrae]|uniref:Crp/Fnr family transcriptional regulator n=1 Tax=Chryseobacterium terrae TaxID=3163299 RepID=A0ABW8Y7S4_9FLAO
MLIDTKLLLKFGAEQLNISKGEYLFRNNESPTDYFQIRSGRIELLDCSPGHRGFTHGVLRDGEAVGETFLLLEKEYLLCARTLTDTEIFKLSKDRLWDMSEEFPEIIMKMWRSAAKQIHYQYLMNNSFYNNPADKINVLLDFMKDSEAGPELSLVDLTRQQIASMLGLRTETVIRAIKNMEKEGKLAIRNGKVFY